MVTERLVLRPPHGDDLPELIALANNRRVADMLALMPPPYGQAEGEAFLAMVAEKPCREATYALALADSGAFIGCAGLSSDRRRSGARLLDRRTLLGPRLCHRGGACAGRSRLPGDSGR